MSRGHGGGDVTVVDRLGFQCRCGSTACRVDPYFCSKHRSGLFAGSADGKPLTPRERALVGLTSPSANGHHPDALPDGRHWLPAWALLPPAGLEPLSARDRAGIEREEKKRRGVRWLIDLAPGHSIEGET